MDSRQTTNKRQQQTNITKHTRFARRALDSGALFGRSDRSWFRRSQRAQRSRSDIIAQHCARTHLSACFFLVLSQPDKPRPTRPDKPDWQDQPNQDDKPFNENINQLNQNRTNKQQYKPLTETRQTRTAAHLRAALLRALRQKRALAPHARFAHTRALEQTTLTQTDQTDRHEPGRTATN